ncbi:ABC transporter, partial [Gardnerella vaginalis]
MNTSTHSYASVIRGMWFQLKSLAKTTFFLQNAILAPVCFALMKIVAYYGFSHDCA